MGIKKILLALLMLCGGLLHSQDNPVKWIGKVKKINNGEYLLEIQAELQPGWCIYSQHIPDGGPVATSISFENSRDYVLEGKSEESSKETKTVNDDVFNMNLKKFYSKASFVQKIRIKNTKLKTIKANISYMSCTDYTCMPPEEEEIVFRM